MIVLDQTYSESNTEYFASAHYSSTLGDEIGQGFTPSISGPVPYVDLWMQRVGSPSGNILVELRSNSSGLPGSVLATSNAIDASTISTSPSKVRFTFSTPYSVTAETLYHLTTLVTYSFSQGVNNIQWAQDGSPSYTRGQDSFLNNGTWQTNSRACPFDQYVESESEPPPPEDEKKILCIGDSITRGWSDHPIFGYRDHLQDKLGIGEFKFVGTLSDPSSDATYDVNHAGINSNRSDEIKDRVLEELETSMENTLEGSKVLLHTGSADIFLNYGSGTQTEKLESYVQNVHDIIDIIDTFNPDLEVYVALVIPSTDTTAEPKIEEYNTLLKEMLLTYQGTKENLFIVDMHKKFTDHSGWETGWLADGYHPNDAGYNAMSEEWFNIIENGNPPPPPPPSTTLGQMSYLDEEGEPVELPIGEEGQVLTVVDGVPKWI